MRLTWKKPWNRYLCTPLSKKITLPDFYVRWRYDTNENGPDESLKEEDEDEDLEDDLEGEEEMEEIIEARDQHIEIHFLSILDIWGARN